MKKKTLLKSVVKLPEKKTMLQVGTNYYVMKAYNKLIDEIGNIDIDEALKEAGWVKIDIPFHTDIKMNYQEALDRLPEEEAKPIKVWLNALQEACDYYEKHYIKREDMELDEEKLAYQLFISELDFVAPDYKTRETWEEWKNIKHEGDCINEPQPCRRCEQDLIYRIAKALAEAFKKGEI